MIMVIEKNWKDPSFLWKLDYGIILTWVFLHLRMSNKIDKICTWCQNEVEDG